ncbi:MAG TPA: ketoacyl-ACP synthase III [Chthonomonadaceae bacterium]|nr:ketoacyl-ACP synthase III [Chthonomonadaceae bacterium]
MLNARIAGLGSCLPAHVVPSDELERAWGLPDGWIVRAAGVRERRYASGESTVGMAADAARQAIAHSGISPGEIDLIIGASITPQQAVPSTSVFVQYALELCAGHCPCFDLNATCLSFLHALHVAAQFVHAGAHRNVLVFSSEIQSISLNPKEPASAVLFGDGAAAAIVSAPARGDASCIWGAQFATDSSGAADIRYAGCGSLHPPNDPATTREMQMFSMNGPAVYRMALKRLPAFIDRFFDRLDWTRESVDAVVPHQASAHGLRMLTEALGFRPEQILSNLEERGNCSAASIPLLLSEAVHARRIRRGDRILLAGTGAGFSMGIVGLTF